MDITILKGQLNSAIAIRTMVVRQSDRGKLTVSVQAGAGLVADSDPETEYEETLNKAQRVARSNSLFSSLNRNNNHQTGRVRYVGAN